MSDITLDQSKIERLKQRFATARVERAQKQDERAAKLESWKDAKAARAKGKDHGMGD